MMKLEAIIGTISLFLDDCTKSHKMNVTELPTTTKSSVLNNVVTLTFSWFDYAIFGTMLTLSVLIGIYFGCFGSKQSTAKEYLMGGKQMKIFPIAMSLVASHISGVTLLAVPADVYRYGAGYWLSIVCFFLMIFPTVYIYIPVFYKLQITSTYEYLERRFDNKTRVFSSFLFALAQLLYLPIVVYIPALAFSAATGINLHLVTPVVCGVCIFYTTIGGLKAVVWTDTLQFTVTLGAVSAVLYLGLKSADGIGNVWRKSIEGQRLDIFDFDPDITKRDNFYALIVGYTFHWISLTNTNQGSMQKFLSVATLRDAKLVSVYYTIGLCIVKSASVFTGLLIYSRYSDCDPFTTKQITRNDQLLPFYVLDVAGSIPGLAGLFIAGVSSAALSTLSAHLNCLSGTIYEDFVSKWMSKSITEKSKSNILKLIVVIAGVTCTLMVFVFEHLGGLLPLTIAFNGVTAGPLLGMFTLGVLFPRVNSKGAFYGGIMGLGFILWISMTATYYKSTGIITYSQKPLTTDECNFEFNLTAPMMTLNETMMPNGTSNGTIPMLPDAPFVLFRISYYFYTLIGCTMTMICGLMITYMTEKDETPTHRDLLSPVIHRWLNTIRAESKVEYSTVEIALSKVVHDSGSKYDDVSK